MFYCKRFQFCKGINVNVAIAYDTDTFQKGLVIPSHYQQQTSHLKKWARDWKNDIEIRYFLIISMVKNIPCNVLNIYLENINNCSVVEYDI